jgi:hypothetical protein
MPSISITNAFENSLIEKIEVDDNQNIDLINLLPPIIDIYI